MNYSNALNYFYGLEQFGSKLGLGRIRLLLQKLGNPQEGLKVIHITGTNGKGSTCAMLSTILSAAGYKTGCYVSPHLVEFRERICINNEMIPEEDVARILEMLKPLVAEVAEELEHPTFFEIITALAFQYFKEQNVDYVAMEVGLGGRLDATNVIVPIAAAITNVSLEHTEVLGDTIDEIAQEKAAIIKKGSPVVTTATGEALDVIKGFCIGTAPLTIVSKPYNGKISLAGEFQKVNAALALGVLGVLELGIPSETVKKALQKVEWPGRMQFLDGFLLDCAHNPAGMKALAKEVRNINKKIILVIGILKDKDYKTMMEEITPLADKIIITKSKSKRALSPEILSRGYECEIVQDIKKAIERARELTNEDSLILITGSIYTVGDALAAMTQG